MVELTTNWFCSTRTRRTQGGTARAGWSARRWPALPPRPAPGQSLECRCRPGAPPPHAPVPGRGPLAPRLQSSVRATTGRLNGLYLPRASRFGQERGRGAGGTLGAGRGTGTWRWVQCLPLRLGCRWEPHSPRPGGTCWERREGAMRLAGGQGAAPQCGPLGGPGPGPLPLPVPWSLSWHGLHPVLCPPGPKATPTRARTPRPCVSTGAREHTCPGPRAPCQAAVPPRIIMGTCVPLGHCAPRPPAHL